MRGRYRQGRPSSDPAGPPSPEGEGKEKAGNVHFLHIARLFCFGAKVT
uniref:Uncharacterized protein n=1 Tax=Ackermannviridae sp. TaxID=2831612 RepID=A0A8S5VK33_9CAUD|nr:MAG TPA: hypothetical protein [Ackermannviridae sp.]